MNDGREVLSESRRREIRLSDSEAQAEDILTGSSETMADDQYEDTYPDSVRAVDDVAGRVALACADLDDVLEVAAGGVALACAPLVRAALPWWIWLNSGRRPRASARSHSRRRTSPGYSVFIISDA
jgi:hypothetical protein